MFSLLLQDLSDADGHRHGTMMAAGAPRASTRLYAFTYIMGDQAEDQIITLAMKVWFRKTLNIILNLLFLAQIFKLDR